MTSNTNETHKMAPPSWGWWCLSGKAWLGFLTLHFNSGNRPYLHFNVVIYKCLEGKQAKIIKILCVTSQQPLGMLGNWGCFLFTPTVDILIPCSKRQHWKDSLKDDSKILQCVFQLRISTSSLLVLHMACGMSVEVLWEWNLQVLTEIAQDFRFNAKQTIIKPCKK